MKNLIKTFINALSFLQFFNERKFKAITHQRVIASQQLSRTTLARTGRDH
jgi:hypothetical protein